MGEVIHVNFAEEHQKREIASETFYIFTKEDGTQFEFTLGTADEFIPQGDVWEDALTSFSNTLGDIWGDDAPALDWDGALTPEDFPLPETEHTLFGWSVRVFDHKLRDWFTLPDYFLTEDSALCRAELYLMAIDFNPHNDNGGNYV